jgi:hypothetical protein
MGVSQTSDGLDGSARGEWRASRRRQKLARSKLSIGAFEFLRARQSRQLVTDTTWTQQPPIGWLQACVNLSCYPASGIGARMPALMRFQALITAMAKLRSAISASEKRAWSLPNSSSLASLCGVAVMISAQRNAARSRSLKNGASR